MKKIRLFILSSFVSIVAFAQFDADSIPTYKKYPNLPAFNLLGLDSTTVFNTFNIPEGELVVLMFFSPDCDHCMQQTQKIIKHIDSLRNVRFYLMTPMNIVKTKEFYDNLNLSLYKNIQVFKDYQFFFPRFYNVKFVPYFAVYDKHKKFVVLMDGSVNIEELKKLQ